MNRTIRFILGYLAGFLVFIILIPAGLFQLSRLDYLIGYKMIIPSIVLRFAISGFLLTAGMVFALWSNLWLLIKGKGGPVDAFGVAISPRSQKLVTSGPYRFTRNPMVFGAAISYLAVVLYLNSFFGLFAWIILVILITVFLKQNEEARLLRDFGDAYLQYRKKVPMIIPFLRFRS